MLIAFLFLRLLALMVKLESLQLAANMAVDAVNAWGSPIAAHFQDVPAHVQEIALHGVRHGAAVALTVAQVQTRYELHAMEIGFPMGDGPEEHEDLLEEFTMAAEAIADITSAQDVVNKVFD